MKNLVLIGFMGSGKTAVGKIAAKKLGLTFVDVDHCIEKAEGHSIAEIFSKQGEFAFRELESKAIEKLSTKSNQVLATGGGVILRNSNIEALKKNGVLICLYVDAQTAYNRIAHSSHRPLLNVKNPREHIEKLLRERQPIYETLPFIISTLNKSPQEVANDVIQVYQQQTKSFS